MHCVVNVRLTFEVHEYISLASAVQLYYKLLTLLYEISHFMNASSLLIIIS